MRIKEIQKTLNENTAALITSDINRFYLTGFSSSAGSVVITKNTATLLVDFRYFEAAQKSVKNIDVCLCKSLYSNIKDLLRDKKITQILIETDRVTIDSLNRIKDQLSDFEIYTNNSLSTTLSKLRQIKSLEEIGFIKASQEITDSAFLHILNFIKEGVTEKEIALELEFFMRRKGSNGVAFETIAVSGKNSSLPHGVPSNKPLEKGDLLTMDFGAVYKGYCSDMTRTVAIGYATEEQRKIYDIVLKAQKEALKNIKPEVCCREIDKAARNIIDEAGFGDCFGHGLGHSVGLEIHENPTCNTRDETPLKKGMIMTVEPGIYIPNKFGVRIEDMVVITDSSFENLTHSPKELIIL